MRELADASAIQRFMLALGGVADQPIRGYLAGGATAVLMAWRATTIDVELASPLDFIPVAPDWQHRSEFIVVHGNVSFFHFDMYAQLLAKIERGHEQDVLDIDEMFRRGLVDPSKLAEYFDLIAPSLYRYPALDESTFRESVKRAVRDYG